ncbi:DNA-processing protein DprA [Pistricoccus aurantiacus]|uniref:DNA-processing protein DprA n=1 Tax=Pistricoccus aurantiacus TaxID=1883414 RepID=UPI00363B5702
MTPQDWLILSLLPNLGPRRLAMLRAKRPVWPQGWLALLPEAPRRMLRLWLEQPGRNPFQSEITALERWLAQDRNHHFLHPGHPHWPVLLDEIADPPAVLWAKGDLSALSPPRVAMVGSRRPTRDGLNNAAAFARGLAERGWCVVSGLALGIDGQAQQTALDAGGVSIAVLGCGVDVIYPPRHARLYRRHLQDGGLLLSEHPPSTPARAAFFPRRNRIVTGLSLGVLVVEAAHRSGSLVSARLAMEQNRDVLVLPGSLHNPQAQGCLGLIRQGATLVTRVEELIDELEHWQANPMLSFPQASGGTASATQASSQASSSSVSSDPLLNLLSDVPTPLDALIALTDKDVSACQLRLLELELEGVVAQVSGGWIRLASLA